MSVGKWQRKGSVVLDVSKPSDVDDATHAFPANVIGRLLPFYDDIPAEFRRDDTDWNGLVREWFYRGLKDATFKTRDGIDKTKALRHVGACMWSFEPAHEHKTAGCAYLLSLWFESVTINGKTWPASKVTT